MKFIESVKFPFSEVSDASAVEKGPGRPPHWEMVFWWTRKPLISARAAIAGCLLDEDTDPVEFLQMIGIKKSKLKNKKYDQSPHRIEPDYKFNDVRLLDPFAGFGSIPLEALRLGLDTMGVELIPSAYVFLKAVLEYPGYGEKLVKDIEKRGKWITEKLRQDELIKKLYDEDVAVYIGSWEIKCPNCGRWTPLIGNWWLARVKSDKGYERLAWMEYEVENDSVKIRIVDMNEELGDVAVRNAKVDGLKVEAKGKVFRVPESNVEARREIATCLLCNQPIMQIDVETEKHYTEKKKDLPKEVKDRAKWYVKYALELYNQSSEAVLPEWFDEVPARPRLLVKVRVVDGDLKFEPCDGKDQEKLEIAEEEVGKLIESGDVDIPREKLAPYGTTGIGGYLQPINYGMPEWFQVFNPRQLLTLVKLVKLIREAGKLIEQKKIEEGLAQEEAFKYAEGVVTYLTIWLADFVDYNSTFNRWNPPFWGLLKVQESLSFRGIGMVWNWCEFHAVIGLEIFIKYILKGLNYLTSVHEFRAITQKHCVLDDATILSKINDKFDLIITDPPYYDDVPYSELSDFYYVWLKRALSDVEDNRLVPRFIPEAFFERFGEDYVEISTQWEKFALSEVSLNPPRLGSEAKKEDGVRHFQNLLNASFVTMASRLKDDGLLVTYYAHTDPDAWKALLEAGWEAAGLRVTNAFPLTTESAQSVVKRGKLSMDTSILVVWRSGSEGSVEASQLYQQMVEESANRAKQLIDLGAVGRDLVIGSLAAALAVATQYREVRVMGKIDVRKLVDEYVYPAALLGLARALARKAEIRDGIKSPDVMFYVLVKSTLAGAKRKVLESTDARIFSIGTSFNLNTALTLRILRGGDKESGARVAKAKTLTLVEPLTERPKLAELLDARGVGTAEPKIRCAVDALHFIEYLALIRSKEEFRRKLDELKAMHPAEVEEALSMAKIMARVLPEKDDEQKLCRRILEHLEIIKPRTVQLELGEGDGN
mgnify:CR=1 FL=1